MQASPNSGTARRCQKPIFEFISVYTKGFINNSNYDIRFVEPEIPYMRALISTSQGDLEIFDSEGAASRAVAIALFEHSFLNPTLQASFKNKIGVIRKTYGIYNETTR